MSIFITISDVMTWLSIAIQACFQIKMDVVQAKLQLVFSQDIHKINNRFSLIQKQERRFKYDLQQIIDYFASLPLLNKTWFNQVENADVR